MVGAVLKVEAHEKVSRSVWGGMQMTKGSRFDSKPVGPSTEQV